MRNLFCWIGMKHEISYKATEIIMEALNTFFFAHSHKY